MSFQTLRYLFGLILAAALFLVPRNAEAHWYSCGYGYTSCYSTTVWHSSCYYPSCHTHCCHFWPHCGCHHHHHHGCHHCPPHHCWHLVGYSWLALDIPSGEVERGSEKLRSASAVGDPYSADAKSYDEARSEGLSGKKAIHFTLLYEELNYYNYCTKETYARGRLTAEGKQRFGGKLDLLLKPGVDSTEKNGARVLNVGASSKRKSNGRTEAAGKVIAAVRQPLDSAETWSVPVSHRGRLAGMAADSPRELAIKPVRRTARLALANQPTASIPIAAAIRKSPVRVIVTSREQNRNPVIAQRPELKPAAETIGVASTLSGFYRLAGSALHASMTPQNRSGNISVETAAITR